MLLTNEVTVAVVHLERRVTELFTMHVESQLYDHAVPFLPL